MAGRLPIQKGNNEAIVAAIEKDRPAGKGHHTSHQTQAILNWLKKREAEKKGSS